MQKFIGILMLSFSWSVSGMLQKSSRIYVISVAEAKLCVSSDVAFRSKKVKYTFNFINDVETEVSDSLGNAMVLLDIQALKNRKVLKAQKINFAGSNIDRDGLSTD